MAWLKTVFARYYSCSYLIHNNHHSPIFIFPCMNSICPLLLWTWTHPTCFEGFPGGSDSKEPTCNPEDTGLIHGSWRSAEGNGDPLQYSGLENSMGSPWGHKELDMTEQLFHFQGLLPWRKSLSTWQPGNWMRVISSSRSQNPVVALRHGC